MDILHQQNSFPIYKICLTGGPCAGKTTALTQLKDYLAEHNFKVFTVPEVPTLTMEGGGMIVMGGLTQDKVCQFQGLLMKAQMNLEDYFYNLAVLNGKPAVILFDRGVMDPKAYMDEPTWQAVLDYNNFNSVYLRDKRYDVVLHLVTAADGAEKFYTLENNQARYEDVPTAIKVDQNLQQSWAGHPHQIIVDNSEEGFDKKIQKVINGVAKFIGISTTHNLFKKYLIDSFEVPSDVKINKFDVEEVFLHSGDGQEYQYIRKRGANGAYSYALTQKFLEIDATKQRVLKSTISAKDYIILLERRDQSMKVIQKERITFIHNKQSYILEKFADSKNNQITILKIDIADTNSNPSIPSWIKVAKEVTGDQAYTTNNLAKIQ